MSDAPAPDAGLNALVGYLQSARGFEFGAYKPSSLTRRIAKRLEATEVGSYTEYIDYLEVHPEEFEVLFDTVLINVTEFYRDPPAWECLAEEILPELISATADRPIRVWCAGCATGEEVYTLAILLVEAMGIEEFRRRVKIYATDVDEAALTQARAGRFTAKAAAQVPDDLRSRYLEETNSHAVFRGDARRSLIFGRNDLLQDAPISRIDLLVCRNTLMYFNAETQGRILSRFNFALNDPGFLFLGRAEMLVNHGDLFAPVNLKWRIFKKVRQHELRHRLAFVEDGSRLDSGGHSERALRLQDVAADLGPVAQVIVDHDGTVQSANRRARAFFGLSTGDIGRPLKDLELSYRPVELRSAIELAYAEPRTVKVGRVNWSSKSGEAERVLDVSVAPLISSSGTMLGATVTYVDVSDDVRKDVQLETSKGEAQVAAQELQATVEELETTNEELQSTNEELETTNEELQSTNEELETTNEELQSTNSELETINEELHGRTGDLDRVNAFLETILASLGVGVVVVDADQRVQVWNRSAERMWGLRADEVEGQRLLDLEIGLPVRELEPALSAAVSGRAEPAEVVVEARNRRGALIECTVRCLPLIDRNGDSHGAILLMGERPSESGHGSS